MALIVFGSPVFAMTVPSETPAPAEAEIPVLSGGMSNTEAFLFGVVLVLLIIIVV